MRFATVLATLAFTALVTSSAAAAPPFYWWTIPKAQLALAKSGISVSRCGGSQPSIPPITSTQPFQRGVTYRYRTFQCLRTGGGVRYIYLRTSKRRAWGFCRSASPVTETAKAEVTARCP